MLELEALGLDRAQTEVGVVYVDHNLLQADERNAEDHEFLRSAARRYGLWFSKPGNGGSDDYPSVHEPPLGRAARIPADQIVQSRGQPNADPRQLIKLERGQF